MKRTRRVPDSVPQTAGNPSEAFNWTSLQKEIRAEWDKHTRPEIVFPSKEARIEWLREGARTGVVPPLPEGAYYE